MNYSVSCVVVAIWFVNCLMSYVCSLEIKLLTKLFMIVCSFLHVPHTSA